MTSHEDLPADTRVVRVSREIAAGAARIFELIADPANQPRWDGNDNLAEAPAGQRVRAVGDVFTMTLTRNAAVRENHVVEFEEGLRIAWRPAEPGRQPPGHLWRWELEPVDASSTRVTHTYDWTDLTDERRYERARATTPEKLQASLDRLATVAERDNR
ncbi:MAG: SRPBCC family protein [Actinophytocola sp.]|uniref:SRPBCC family protein n=1 Tax=Actinophytocola sp. TaxID=1872138 RepID=UPI003D6C6D7C